MPALCACLFFRCRMRTIRRRSINSPSYPATSWRERAISRPFSSASTRISYSARTVLPHTEGSSKHCFRSTRARRFGTAQPVRTAAAWHRCSWRRRSAYPGTLSRKTTLPPIPCSRPEAMRKARLTLAASICATSAPRSMQSRRPMDRSRAISPRRLAWTARRGLSCVPASPHRSPTQRPCASDFRRQSDWPG